MRNKLSVPVRCLPGDFGWGVLPCFNYAHRREENFRTFEPTTLEFGVSQIKLYRPAYILRCFAR